MKAVLFIISTALLYLTALLIWDCTNSIAATGKIMAVVILLMVTSVMEFAYICIKK